MNFGDALNVAYGSFGDDGSPVTRPSWNGTTLRYLPPWTGGTGFTYITSGALPLQVPYVVNNDDLTATDWETA